MSISKMSLRSLKPEPYPEGNNRLSSEIDAVIYDGVAAPDRQSVDGSQSSNGIESANTVEACLDPTTDNDFV